MHYRHMLLLLLFIAYGPNTSLAAVQNQDQPNIAKGQLLQAPTIVRSAKTNTSRAQQSSIVFQDDFESGSGNWTTGGSWAVGAPSSGPNSGHSSSRCAATNLSGNYGNNADDWLRSVTIALPNLSGSNSSIKLYFQEWFELESGYDIGKTFIKTNGSSTWRQIDSRSGASTWRETMLDVSSYAGQTVQIAFTLTSDGSITNYGWYIDDIKIMMEGAETTPLSATMISLNHQAFPFIYMNVGVQVSGTAYPHLNQSNFKVYENNILQTNYFEVLKPQEGGGSRLTDIVFIMDNSGSMSEEQNAIRNNVIDFVNNLSSSGVDFALGLCRYGQSENSGMPILEENGQLTQDANYFKYTIWGRNVAGGGNEPGYYAITQSASGFSFRPGAQKVFIIITDETPDQGYSSMNDALNTCANGSITLFALTETDLYEEFEPVTNATNGDCYDIYSNFDDILDYISNLVANSYRVRYYTSDPVKNGVRRNVEVVVDYNGTEATTTGSYIPASAPEICRTENTIAYQDHASADGARITIEVNISDNVYPYTQSATLYYKNSSSSTYRWLAMSHVSGTLWRGVISGSYVYSPGIDYYIMASDGENTASDPTVEPIDNPYQIAVLPNVAPEIEHTPPTTLAPEMPITITAEISDNTNGVTGAQLFYRKRGQLIYEHRSMSHSYGNVYETQIPGSFAVYDGVEYYLRAWDNYGVHSYCGTADDPHTIYDSSMPDFYIKVPGTFPATCTNEPFLHEFYISNSGDPSHRAVKVCIYASRDRNIESSDYTLGCTYVTPEDFGNRDYFYATIECDPSGLESGNYYFGFIIDPDNEINEANKNDNDYCSSTTTTVTNNFTINITSPRNGDDWQLGSRHDILWESSGSGNVQIKLYEGSNYYRTIVSGTANDGRYSWYIPENYSSASNYKIRIISTSNASVSDESDGYFSLTAPQHITIISPNGNENWELGGTHTLAWTSNAGGNVKISLYKNGSLYKIITSSTTNDGSYQWSIPSSYTANDRYKIRISSTANTSLYDESDAYFSLIETQHITVTSPNGNENWELGSTHTISWDSNAGGNVKISLYKYGSLYKIITSSTNNDGSYQWSIPSNYTTTYQYKIRITSTSNTSLWDESDDYFALTAPQQMTVTSPNGNENWELGSAYTISWNSNISGNVKISLYKYGSLYKTITSSTNNDGSYQWSIPSNYTATYQYKIRITSTANTSLYDASDDYFALISPSNNEVVWPGDANNSGYVDQADILPIGLYFHSTGTARANAPNNSWNAQECAPWSNTAAMYADCNGSGAVDQADILAIGLNWHKSHSSLAKSTIDPSLEKSLAMELKSGIDAGGHFVEISVDNAVDLQGISFEMDMNLTEGGITSVNYSDAFQTNNIHYEQIVADRAAIGACIKPGVSALNSTAKICQIYYRGQTSDDMQLQNVLGLNSHGDYVSSEREVYSLAANQIIKPEQFTLYPAYPNPFNPTTTIRYDIPQDGLVRLDILNIKGEVIRSLVQGHIAAGSYAVQWDATRENGKKAASGVYLYRLQTNANTATRKLLFTK